VFKGKARLEYHNSWVTANCDQSTLEYYRWWFWKNHGEWLMKPRNGAHISVIRGRDELNPKDFLFNHARLNRNIEFFYSNNLDFRYDGYVWMPVWGKCLNDVREECGFPIKPIMPFHMTIGRLV